MAAIPSSDPVFFLRHDWAQPLTERLTWATEVLRKANGEEVRTPLRLLPRRQITYFVGHDPLMRALVADWAEQYQGLSALYPLPHQGVCVRRAAPAGTSALTIDANAWTSGLYRPTYPAVSYDSRGPTASSDPRALSLLLHDGGWQIVAVTAEAPGVLYLDGPLIDDAPAGAVLMPLRQGRCTQAVALDQWSGGWAGGTLTVQIDAALDVELVVAPATDPVLKTLPAWPDGDWAETLSASAQSALTAFDFSQADPAWRRDDDVPMTTFSRSVTATGQEAADWLERLYAARGRAGGFWLADGLAPDMRLASVAFPGTTVLDLDGAPAVAGLWRQDAAVRIGMSLDHRVAAYATCAAPSDTNLVLDIPGLSDFAPAGSAVTRLLPCRLDADAVELGWIAPQTVQLQFTARRIAAPLISDGGVGY